MQTNAWLPTTHAEYWKKYKDKLEDLGAWYDKTSLEIAVPSYMKDVKTLDDLKGKGGKFGGKIAGIEPGAGEMKILKDKVLKDYGLGGEYKVMESSTSSMLTELDRSIHDKKPIAVTLWSPHWAYDKYKLTKLKDPKGSFGSGDSLHMLGRKGFSKDEPQVARWMKNFHLDEKQLTSLENEVKNAGTGHEQEGVRAWLKQHPGLVNKLAPSANAAVRQGQGRGQDPDHGLPGVGRGHRHHVPLEEHSGEARLPAEDPEPRCRADVDRTVDGADRRRNRCLASGRAEAVLGQVQEGSRRRRGLVRQDLAGDRRTVLRQGREDPGRPARAQGRLQAARSSESSRAPAR